MYIYKTENKINGRIYIGKDTRGRCSYLGSGKILKHAILKYGKENFIKTIIEECFSPTELNLREIYWIDFYKKCGYDLYNIALGGDGGKTRDVPWNKGKILPALSKEHKNKISKALLGHVQTEVTRNKIAEGHRGKQKSTAHRQKLSIANTGKVLTDKTKEKMSQARRGRSQKIITCPHCGKNGGTVMRRWHFENCPSLRI